MSQTFHYFHPLTPESARYDIDLGTAAVRLGDVPGWATAAEMGDVAQTNIVIDDPDGTAGNAGDAILGLWTFYVEEDDCPDTGSGGDGTGGTRLFTGYITDRTYRRGNTAPSTSLVQGPARRIDISLTDVNALATFRIIAGEGSGADDGNRPAETDVERVQWLISTVWLPVTDDAGWVDTGNPVDMDACDYRGQTPADILSDCSLASGKNWWIGYFEPTNTDVLWYQDSNTSTEYTSDITLSDDLADVDFVTCFPYMPDAELRRSPERVYAGVYLPYANGAVYEENGTTAGVFAWRDGSAPTSNVSTEAKATAVASRLLADADSEDDRIICRVQLPSSLATAIKAGQRLQFRSTFMPGYEAWRWCRVVRCSVAQDEETSERYTFSLEMSPQGPAPDYFLVAYVVQYSGLGGAPIAPTMSAGAVWETLQTYSVGNLVHPTGTGPFTHSYQCITAGLTAGAEPTWPTGGGTVTDGTVVWRDIGSIWTQAYWSGDIADPTQFPGPANAQAMGIWYRRTVAGETNEVLRMSGGGGFATAAWVVEVTGVSAGTTPSVVSGKDSPGPVGAVTSVSASAGGTSSAFIAGQSLSRPDYSAQLGWSSLSGTKVLDASAADRDFADADGLGHPYPPDTLIAWTSGTGTLTVGGTITNAPGGDAGSFNLWGRGYAGLLFEETIFAIVQRGFIGYGGGGVVTLPDAP